MEYVVRQATMDDIEGIVELWQKLSYGQIIQDEYFKGNLHFTGGTEQFTEALNNDKCYISVIDKGGRILGFAETWLYDKDFHFYVDDYAYILHFFIEPELRNSLATIRLYKSAEKWAIAQGSKYLVADVFEHNQRVQKLLEFVKLKPYRVRMAKDLTKIENSNEGE